ncbi:MAG: DUF6677 family protein [Planctomycetota bacterium]|nr:DUF6677 family protein [Planctomycetota bacterium]
MTRKEHLEFNPLALVLACVLPGLGHAARGEVRRGLCIAAGILGLFFGGMLIGGIDVVDRVEDKWWFLLQAGVGPTAFAADAVHQKMLKVPGPSGRPQTPLPGAAAGSGAPRITKSLGRVNEVGSLYTALAGMLNMIAIIDAGWFFPRPRPSRRAEAAAPPGARTA